MNSEGEYFESTCLQRRSTATEAAGTSLRRLDGPVSFTPSRVAAVDDGEAGFCDPEVGRSTVELTKGVPMSIRDVVWMLYPVWEIALFRRFLAHPPD